MAGRDVDDETRVAVVGAGFSGIGAAIRLLRAGESDFVVLERASDLGGTWRDNLYPGCRCDVPSRLYSYSFAPDPDWRETFAGQEEIWDYLRRTAQDSGILPHMRFGRGVLDAEWDEGTRRWRLDTDHGVRWCRYLIWATGAFAEPRTPELPGLDRFAGTVMHSARWDRRHRFEGERVGVVGTGASAVQIVPALQPEAAHLSVFQRTPGWVLPHPVRSVGSFERRVLARSPRLLRLLRALVYWQRELVLVPAFTKYDGIRSALERQARRHLARQVPDPVLRAKLTPDYQLGCKRILPSDDFYPALTKDNVELVTEAITEVTEDGIGTADGAHHRLDSIVFATGFQVSDNPTAEHVTGRGAVRLGAALRGELDHYLGTTFPKFPNFFMLSGPNTGTGHTSQLFMVECQLDYVLDALGLLGQMGDPVLEVLEDAAAHHSAEVERRSRRSVWCSGCSSWYQDASGRNVTMWPDFTFVYRRRTRRFDPSEYTIGEPTAIGPDRSGVGRAP